jgi:hypothetical protein
MRSTIVRPLLVLSAVLLLLPFATATAFAQSSFHMSQIGRLTGGTPAAAAVDGAYAYVAAGGVLNVLDISDPTQPDLVRSVDTPGGARGLLQNGTVLFVAEGEEGVVVYSLATPGDPQRLGTYDTPGRATALDLYGSTLYVADDIGGIQRFQVTSPTTLVSLGTLFEEPDFYVADVEATGSLVYAMGIRAEYDLFFPTLKILDLTTFPVTVITHEYPWQGSQGEVVVDGVTVYLANGLSTIHVAAFIYPSTFVPLADISAPASSIELVGHTLYAAGGLNFEVFDVTNPASAVSLGEVATAGRSGTFCLQGSNAILPEGSAGVEILDAADPASMSVVGRSSLPRDALGLAFDGSYLYAATSGQMYVVSPSTLDPMTVVGATGGGWTVEPTDYGIVYVAGGGARAVDITDPSHPTNLSSYNPGGQTLDVSAYNKTVYSAVSYEGFAIADFSDPTDPQPLGAFTDYSIRELVARGNYVYVAGSGGLEAFDVSDPATPISTSSVPYTDYVGELRISQGHLFASVGTEGIRIFDLTDPSQLVEVGNIPAQVRMADVVVRGNHATVADGTFVRVYDISDLSNPVEVAYHETPGTVRSVEAYGPSVFAGVYETGIYAYVVDVAVTGVEPAASPLWLRVWPNPTHGRANLAFELPFDDRVTLDVYDVAGRLVRRWERPATAGQRTTLSWDALDRWGQPVSNGVYLYRLRTSRESRSGRFVLLR